MRYVLFLLSLLLCALPAWATTYWANPNCNNCDTNSCQAAVNQTTPKQTINNAIGCLNSGDTLIVRNGLYSGGTSVASINMNGVPNGTSSAPTVVKTETLHGVVLQPTSGFTVAVISGNKHWLVLDGFVFDLVNAGYNAGGINLDANGGASDNLVQNIEIKNVKADDFNDGSGDYITTAGMGATGLTTNTIIRNMLVHDIGNNCNGGGCCAECYGYGIYLSGSGYTLENSEFYNTSSWIMHGYTSENNRTTDNIVRNNYFHHGGGPFLLCQGGNQIYNNIIEDVGHFGRSEGDGLRLAVFCANQPSSGNVIYNNTIVNAAGSCINLGNSTNGAIRNNICYQNSTNAVVNGGSGNAISNNLLGTNPLFVGTGGGIQNFRLNTGSPAIDAGTSTGSIATLVTTDIGGNPRPQPPGGARDIGAWEFITGGPPPLPNQMLAHWMLDEASGPTAVDDTGNGFTGTLVGSPVRTTGRVGPRALSFPSPNQYVEVATSFNLPLYTWALWFRSTQPSSGTVQKNVLNNGMTTAAWGFNWGLDFFPPGQQAAYHQDSGGTFYNAKIQSTLATNVWYHIATTYDGSSLRMYLNGVLQQTTVAPAALAPSGTLRFGSDSQGCDCSLDDVRLYNFALSGPDVLFLYTSAAVTGIRRHAMQWR